MLKVMIAGDEPLSLQKLSGQMRDLLGADALIEGVANGREAVERARQIQPQLVLMDIEMPVMNGLDAAAIIHKAMPETHIVFLTAFDRFDYAVGAMRAGGTDYLVKPFDSAQITACLRKLNLLPESRPAVCGDKPGNTFCTQFSVWLEHHYMQDVSLDQAAEAMGMTSVQMYRRVIFPQAVVFALPLFANQFLSTMKSTSIVFVITVIEVFGAAKLFCEDNSQYFEAYIVAACLYWGMGILFEFLFTKLEDRLSSYKRCKI